MYSVAAIVLMGFLTLCSQSRCEGIDLLLQLRDSVISLFLALAAGRGDDALSFCLEASLTRLIRTVGILLAFDF